MLKADHRERIKMGEAKRKRQKQAQIISNAERCIYCAATSDFSLEHMPPRSLFNKKSPQNGLSRPSGLVFAACKRCNNGTKGSDSVAHFFSRIQTWDDSSFWESEAGRTLIATMDRDAPGVRSSVFHNHQPQTVRIKNLKTGFKERKVSFQADSPLLKAYLDMFSAKMGMALYFEHVGIPLPLNGGVQTYWFLNSGMPQQQVDKILAMLPIHNTLRQGKINVIGQFSYRYNCDQKSILAALISLHDSLRILVFATSTPNRFEMPFHIGQPQATANFVRAGELLTLLPT